MAQDPYKYFRVEARELADQLSRGVLELEKGASGPELVQRLLRLAHTLKGAARVVKQKEIAELAHSVEDALSPLRDKPASLVRGYAGQILELVDSIAAQVTCLGPSVDLPRRIGASAPVADEMLHTVRADVGEMDALLDGISETNVQIAALRRAVGSMERVRHLAALLLDQLATRRPRDLGGAPNGGTAEKAKSLAEEIHTAFAAAERDLAGGMDQLMREMQQVQHAAEHLRLLPAAALFSALDRAARDAALALGKHVEFEAKGGGERLDAHVLNAVQGALVQLVRNAVVHGIEPPAARTAAGKPAAGHVSVEVARCGNRAVFRCRDDGRGIDLDAIRRFAREKGLSAAETQKLGPEDLFRLLLKGGLSTSGAVTELSGRGVGLDVVREAALRLGGEVTVETRPGAGTTFEVTVPAIRFALDALLVEAGDITAAIPVDAVQQVLRLSPEEAARAAESNSFLAAGNAIPFVALSGHLAGGNLAAGPTRVRTAVVVRSGKAAAAIGVDRLLGTANVVLRPLPGLAPAIPVCAGTSLDAEGHPRVVLDPTELVALALHQEPTTQPSAPAARPPVLVIDDSLTTRMLEQSILESAGYEVDLAVSGEEAIEKARQRKYTLFLVDVEMPGMDGFTFIERTSADPALRGTPAILITSRSSAEDRLRGQQVGARAYIVKSEFDQTELLETIRKLVA